MATDEHDDRHESPTRDRHPMGQRHLHIVPGGTIEPRPAVEPGAPPGYLVPAAAWPGPLVGPSSEPWPPGAWEPLDLARGPFPPVEDGAWSAEQIRQEISRFRQTPTGRYLTVEQSMALRDALTLPRKGFEVDGYFGLVFPRLMLDPDLPALLPDTPVSWLRGLPTALRAWVRHCHRYAEHPDPHLTTTVMDLIDDSEGVWLRALDREERRRRSNRPLLLAKLAEYAGDVGGEDVLWSLDCDPLPDEPVQLDDLDADTALLVVQISELCDAVFSSDSADVVEVRTVSRRLLGRLAREAPTALRRPRAASLAAAISYAAVHSNVDLRRDTWYATDNIAVLVGANPSGVPARARKLLATLGIEQPPIDERLPPRFRRRLLRVGTPDLLISARRSFLSGEAGYISCRLADCDDH